jgi:hypothetical protein
MALKVTLKILGNLVEIAIFKDNGFPVFRSNLANSSGGVWMITSVCMYTGYIHHKTVPPKKKTKEKEKEKPSQEVQQQQDHTTGV